MGSDLPLCEQLNNWGLENENLEISSGKSDYGIVAVKKTCPNLVQMDYFEINFVVCLCIFVKTKSSVDSKCVKIPGECCDNDG